MTEGVQCPWCGEACGHVPNLDTECRALDGLPPLRCVACGKALGTDSDENVEGEMEYWFTCDARNS